MTPSEAKRLKAGDVVADDAGGYFSRRCIVTRVEVLSPARVNVYIEGRDKPLREHQVYTVTESHTNAWAQEVANNAKREARAAEHKAVGKFFGVVPLMRGGSWDKPSEDWTVTLTREQALAFMARLENANG